MYPWPSYVSLMLRGRVEKTSKQALSVFHSWVCWGWLLTTDSEGALCTQRLAYMVLCVWGNGHLANPMSKSGPHWLRIGRLRTHCSRKVETVWSTVFCSLSLLTAGCKREIQKATPLLLWDCLWEHQVPSFSGTEIRNQAVETESLFSVDSQPPHLCAWKVFSSQMSLQLPVITVMD